RAAYDPFATFIPPHITLVFPFESDLTAADLEAHIWSAVRDTVLPESLLAAADLSPLEFPCAGTSAPRARPKNWHDVPPIPVALAGGRGAGGESLFLNNKRGTAGLIPLHNRLYTGILAPYLAIEHTYLPHLTVGRLGDTAAFHTALAEARRMLGDAMFKAEI